MTQNSTYSDKKKTKRNETKYKNAKRKRKNNDIDCVPETLMSR